MGSHSWYLPFPKHPLPHLFLGNLSQGILYMLSKKKNSCQVLKSYLTCSFYLIMNTCIMTTPKANEPRLYSINKWHSVSLWAWKWKQILVRGSFKLQAFIVLVRCKNSTVEHGFASKQHQEVTFLYSTITHITTNLPFWRGKSCF